MSAAIVFASIGFGWCLGVGAGLLIRASLEQTPTERCLDCLTKLTRERRANDARERGELV